MWFPLLLLACREPLGPPPGPVHSDAPRAWERVLSQVVDSEGNVDYDRLGQEREALEGYVRWLEQPGANAGRHPQQPHAFWLNAFNALVLYEVVARDVQTSVNEIPSALPWEGSRFWFGTEFVVLGEPMSLWEIGHERVTHTTQDYRDFAALAVAARSGPPVRPELYDPVLLELQLEDQMGRFMASDRGVRLDEAGAVWFNPLFDRYGVEIDVTTFGIDLCTLAAVHTTGARAERLLVAAEAGCPHRYFEFDWSLNRSGR